MLRRRFENGTLTNDTPGLRAIYSGDLQSSSGIPLGNILQEASYFADRPLPSARQAHHGGYNYLRRSLKPSVTVREASQQIALDSSSSQQMAWSLARVALLRVSSAGGPGSGKR